MSDNPQAEIYRVLGSDGTNDEIAQAINNCSRRGVRIPIPEDILVFTRICILCVKNQIHMRFAVSGERLIENRGNRGVPHCNIPTHRHGSEKRHLFCIARRLYSEALRAISTKHHQTDEFKAAVRRLHKARAGSRVLAGN